MDAAPIHSVKGGGSKEPLQPFVTTQKTLVRVSRNLSEDDLYHAYALPN